MDSSPPRKRRKVALQVGAPPVLVAHVVREQWLYREAKLNACEHLTRIFFSEV